MVVQYAHYSIMWDWMLTLIKTIMPETEMINMNHHQSTLFSGMGIIHYTP